VRNGLDGAFVIPAVGAFVIFAVRRVSSDDKEVLACRENCLPQIPPVAHGAMAKDAKLLSKAARESRARRAGYFRCRGPRGAFSIWLRLTASGERAKKTMKNLDKKHPDLAVCRDREVLLNTAVGERAAGA
jgi:hypothetical protein